MSHKPRPFAASGKRQMTRNAGGRPASPTPGLEDSSGPDEAASADPAESVETMMKDPANPPEDVREPIATTMEGLEAIEREATAGNETAGDAAAVLPPAMAEPVHDDNNDNNVNNEAMNETFPEIAGPENAVTTTETTGENVVETAVEAIGGDPAEDHGAEAVETVAAPETAAPAAEQTQASPETPVLPETPAMSQTPALSQTIDATVETVTKTIHAIADTAATTATAAAHSPSLLKGMEKMMKSTEELVAFGQANMEAFMKSGQIWAAGLQDLTKQMTTTAKTSFEESVSTFKALSTAKSIKEAMDLQSSFAKTAFEKAMAESNKITDASIKLTEQTLAPITARVTTAVETFGKTV